MWNDRNATDRETEPVFFKNQADPGFAECSWKREKEENHDGNDAADNERTDNISSRSH